MRQKGATGSGGFLWSPGRPWTGPSIPNASGSLYVEDFSMYTWGRGAAVPPEGTWEESGG